MADFKDEAHSPDPVNNEPGNPPGEIMPATDTAITNPNQETQQMEVHKHAHHVTHKKKWSEYLLEFSMLFLAVFLGFLAEYQLEHKIERERENVYIESMIEDLVADTTNLSETIKDYDKMGLKIDTLLTMYNKLAIGYNDTLRRNFTAILGYPDFIYSDRTMMQLKSSGNMRLIQNNRSADAIMGYDSNVRDYEIDEGSMNEIHSRIRELWLELMDLESLEIDRKSKSIVEMENGNKNYLLVSDKAKLGQFNNMIRDYQKISILVKNQEIRLRSKATELIALLKNEYHINNK
jgi:hypothetical protein